MYSFLSSDVWNTIGNQYYMLKLTVISPVSTQGWWIWVVGYFRILSKMGSVTGSLCLQKFLHLSRSIASSQITGSGSLVELTSQLATRTFHLTDCYCFGFLNWQGCESIQKKGVVSGDQNFCSYCWETDLRPFVLYILGIYQVQTNLSVQTVQTSIWATGSTSKGCGGLGNFTLNRPP